MGNPVEPSSIHVDDVSHSTTMATRWCLLLVLVALSHGWSTLRLVTRRHSRPLTFAPSDHDYSDEETLLCLHLTVEDEDDLDHALQKVRRYSQKFPFGLVLPVQPLTYQPTDDGGVELWFLRKKTDAKSGMDGGMRFFVEKEADQPMITVTAKRNSAGQAIRKMMAEKIVIRMFVDGLVGQGDHPELAKYAPSDFVKLHSVFYPWM